MMPLRPTFALSLDALPESLSTAKDRIFLPTDAKQGAAIAMWPFKGIGGFAMSILNAAKDWQDNLQSALPGYRERIVRVALKEDEGGLNLAMPKSTTQRLMEFGDKAGETFVTEFRCAEHRWRRTLASYHAIDGLGQSISVAWPRTEADFLAYLPHVESYKVVVPWAEEGLPKAFSAWQTAYAAHAPRSDTTTERFPQPYLRLRASLDI
jgi:hypothetical protein